MAGSITIRIGKETASKIRKLGSGGDTYDTTIRRLIGSVVMENLESRTLRNPVCDHIDSRSAPVSEHLDDQVTYLDFDSSIGYASHGSIEVNSERPAFQVMPDGTMVVPLDKGKMVIPPSQIGEASRAFRAWQLIGWPGDRFGPIPRSVESVESVKSD
jgi:hypothetical protein